MADQLIRFGKLSLLYENGFVRYIRAGETEIIRNIYFALRDNNWATAPVVRSDERISVTPKYFEIAYTATNVVDDKDVFRWHVKIAGNETGEVDFAVDGECLAPYNRNRAGICVLHPIRDTRGKELEVTRPDGSLYKTVFPSTISPHQPFLDIQKMSWQIIGDTRAHLQFDGDIFETEDQRNWGDDSFKTYGTPLTKPYPVMLKPGDKVNQRVRLTLVNGESLRTQDLAEDIEVTIDERDQKPFPILNPDYLKIELDVPLSSWTGPEKPFIHLVIPTSYKKANIDELLKPVLPAARKLFPNSQIGAGFTSYFTELNRNRFDYSDLDFVIYPLTQQAHLNDVHTTIENLPAQKDQLETAKTFVKNKKIHVGPVYLESPIGRLEAGWMLACIKYLSEGGADYVTMSAAFGTEMQKLLSLNPGKVIASACNEPMIITSLVIEGRDQRHLILVNHASSKKSVVFGGELYTLSEYEIKFIPLK
jgi:hypothetical protein